jgi:hypothetical protein
MRVVAVRRSSYVHEVTDPSFLVLGTLYEELCTRQGAGTARWNEPAGFGIRKRARFLERHARRFGFPEIRYVGVLCNLNCSSYARWLRLPDRPICQRLRDGSPCHELLSVSDATPVRSSGKGQCRRLCGAARIERRPSALGSTAVMFAATEERMVPPSKKQRRLLRA